MRWRSDVIAAFDIADAIARVQRTDYGMEISGPFEAGETTDEVCSCWSPKMHYERCLQDREAKDT